MYRLARAVRNYGNPLSLALQRKFKRGDDIVTVVDRRTGMAFDCKRTGEPMMGEVFHAHVYDIPLVPLRRGDVVFDVGANHGFYSCYAASQGAIVHAFEPQDDTFVLLERNLERNHHRGSVHAHHCAVGDHDGEAELFVTDRLGGGLSSIVTEFVDRTRMDVKRRCVVCLTRLETAIDSHRIDRIRLCKLDCEGAEFQIMTGLRADLLDRIDAFALEYHPQAYPIGRLIDLILGWKRFHVSIPDTAKNYGVSSSVLHLVHEGAIRDYFHG